MVEYSAFNRFVPGSSPGQPNVFSSNKNHLFLPFKRSEHTKVYLCSPPSDPYPTLCICDAQAP